MTRITDTHQAARLYKSMVKEGWAAELELIDYHYDNYISVVPNMDYIVNIRNEKGDIVESHEITMSQDAADVWLSGGIEE